MLIVTTGDGSNGLWSCLYPEHMSYVSPRQLVLHAGARGARVQRCETFNHLAETPRQRLRRRPEMLNHFLAGATPNAAGHGCLAAGGRGDGVPGTGLTRDHLLLMLSR